MTTHTTPDTTDLVVPDDILDLPLRGIEEDTADADAADDADLWRVTFRRRWRLVRYTSMPMPLEAALTVHSAWASGRLGMLRVVLDTQGRIDCIPGREISSMRVIR